MITYEQKAEIFTRALAAAGGDVVEALRQTDREARRGRRAARTEALRARAQWLRAVEGKILADIATELGITEGYASMLCRGIRPPPKAIETPRPNPLGEEICVEVARQLGLDLDWTAAPTRRGRKPAVLEHAWRAAVLAMREAGLRFTEISVVIKRRHATVISRLQKAMRDRDARRTAATVLQAVRGSEPAAQGRAA